MTRILALAALALLPACAPKVAPRDAFPAPLEPRDFQVPTPSEAKLSNGLRVVLLENHEVPLVYVRIALVPGGWTDPVGKEGLAEVTLDMMNEGAGPYDAAGLSLALKKLGSSLGAGADDDGAAISIRSLSRNLAPTLDLLATVTLQPTFPEADWALMRKNRVADIEKRRTNPERIAARVFDRVLFGEAYRGRAPTESSYAQTTPADMRAWWSQNVVPDNAIVLVGGDTTLAEIVPLLEARFGAWKGTGAAVTPPDPAPAPPQTAIHLVDKPGAAQSVLRYGGYVAQPTDPDWFALLLANQVMGGQFTSRINMNLREQKGWTYGARTSLGYDHAGGRWWASAGVHSDKTVPALQELLKEIQDATGPRPFAGAEVDDARAAIVYSWPLRFESPDYLLAQTENVWRYGLPKDWISAYPDRLRAVALDETSTAWASQVAKESLTMVVVGDAALIAGDLASLGLPIVRRDADGNIIDTPGRE